MACNYCNRPFSTIRRNKPCPSCGFSFCSRCLNNTILVKKLNEERKVCIKCSRFSSTGEVHMIPPPDYYRQISNKTHPEIDNLSCADGFNKIRAAIDENSPTTSHGYPRSDDLGSIKTTLPIEVQRRILDDFTEGSDSDFDENDSEVSSDASSDYKLFKANLHEYCLQNNKSSEDILRNSIEQLKAGNMQASLLFQIHPACVLCIANATVCCKGCKSKFCMRCFDLHIDDVCFEYETLAPHGVSQS